MLGQDRVITNDVKMRTYWCYKQMQDIIKTNRKNALAPKQVQLITMHSYDLQTKVVQSKGWLSAIVGI